MPHVSHVPNSFVSERATQDLGWCKPAVTRLRVGRWLVVDWDSGYSVRAYWRGVYARPLLYCWDGGVE